MKKQPTADAVLAALPSSTVTVLRVLFRTGVRHAVEGLEPLKNDQTYMAGYDAALQWRDAAFEQHLRDIASHVG